MAHKGLTTTLSFNTLIERHGRLKNDVLYRVVIRESSLLTAVFFLHNSVADDIADADDVSMTSAATLSSSDIVTSSRLLRSMI